MTTLTAEETELYDRQIRAWGFEAQKRMRESKILVVGLDGAGSETLKNLVLAGLGNITILEDRRVDAQLVETHFYLQSNHLKQRVAEVALSYFSEMNPNIKLSVCCDDPFSKTDDYYKSFDVVIISNHSRCLQLRINAICHSSNIGYFSSRSIGQFGYIFADLQEHQYQIALKNANSSDDRKDGGEGDIKKIESLQWSSLESALNVSCASMEKQMRGKAKKYRAMFYALQICEQIEDHIMEKNTNDCNEEDKSKAMKMRDTIMSVQTESSPYHQVFTEIKSKINKSGQFTPNQMEKEREKALGDMLSVWNLSVCPSNAMLGGYLANYVMFYVQRKQKPLHNFLFFDMWSCEGMEMLMRNAKDEEADQQRQQEQKTKAMEAVKSKKNAEEQPDISKLTVGHEQDGVVLLDDSDEDEDIDLID